MISSLFKFAGQIIGEVVHQADVVIEDIKNIPDAIAAGYEEELFTKKPTPTPEVPAEEV